MEYSLIQIEYSLILGYFPGLRLKAESVWFLTQFIGFHPAHPVCTMVKLCSSCWSWGAGKGPGESGRVSQRSLQTGSLSHHCQRFLSDPLLHSEFSKGKFLFIPLGSRTCGRLKVLVKGTCWFQCSAGKMWDVLELSLLMLSWYWTYPHCRQTS